MAIPELKVAAWQFLALSDWSIQWPIRPFWRLYWNDAPGAALCCNGETIPLEPEHVVILPPYSFFSSRLARPVNHFFIHFMTGARFADLERSVAVLPVPTMLHRIIRSDAPAERQELRLFALLLEVLAELPRRRDGAAAERMDPRILEAIIRLDTLPRNRCANGVIARELCMGESNYAHLFRKCVGISPQQYLNRSQMDRARMQLRSSDQSISEIALELGFADRYHFSTVFSRFNGISPAAYRRRCRGDGAARTDTETPREEVPERE